VSAVAIALVLTAALAHASWNILAHGASRQGLVFLWAGSVVSTVLWLPVVPFTGGIGTDDLRGFALGIGVSAVLHVAYMLVLQQGYRLGSLSTVYATARGTGPLLTVIVAILILGERPTPLSLVGVAAVIVGVVALGLVDRERTPGIRRSLDLGIVFGLLTGVGIAAYTVWDAFALREWSVSPVAYMVACTLVETVIFTGMMGRRRFAAIPGLVRGQWMRLLAFGALSPLSYILVLTAFTIAPVALVAPMREVSVAIVSLFGAFVLRERRPGWRILASCVVVVGIILLAQ
jgi:drug/metabolite transporter (DMT)-like permease